MTTIAVSKTEIAYDSQVTWGNTKHRCAFDKVQVKHGRIYAFAGDYQFFKPAMKWHNKGARPGKAPEGMWDLLVIRKKGMTLFSGMEKYGVDMEAPLCLGSGGDVALGVLESGGSARKALKAAARRDCFTGYKIKVINIAKTLKIARWAEKERRREEKAERAKRKERRKARKAEKKEKKVARKERE